MYFGPKKLIRPDSLGLFEQENKYIIEPKINGIWAELTIGPRNKFVSKNGNIIGPNLLDGLENIKFPNHLYGSKFMCEVETETEWATPRRKNRGYCVLWIHSILFLGCKPFQHVPYIINKQELDKVYNNININIRNRIYLMPYSDKNFSKNYRIYKNEYCDEGAVLKNKNIGLVGANGDGKSRNWIKIKDFPYT